MELITQSAVGTHNAEDIFASEDQRKSFFGHVVSGDKAGWGGKDKGDKGGGESKSEGKEKATKSGGTKPAKGGKDEMSGHPLAGKTREQQIAHLVNEMQSSSNPRL